MSSLPHTNMYPLPNILQLFCAKCAVNFSFHTHSSIRVCSMVCHKDTAAYQRDKDSSPNLSFNGLKQREIELEQG